MELFFHLLKCSKKIPATITEFVIYPTQAIFYLEDSWDRQDLTDEVLTTAHAAIFDDNLGGRRNHNDWQPYPGSRETLAELDQLGYDIYF